MNKRGKRAQMQISFGFLMSIIIIAATLGVSFYIISHFLKLNECTKIGLFFDDIEEEVNKAYRSSIYQDVFVGALPSKIDFVCFGNLTQSYDPRFVNEQESLRNELSRQAMESKLFLYPTNKACDGKLASDDLKNSETEKFFCVEVNKGQISVKISKGSFDAKAKISEP